MGQHFSQRGFTGANISYNSYMHFLVDNEFV
jgi:hypothetical protein